MIIESKFRLLIDSKSKNKFFRGLHKGDAFIVKFNVYNAMFGLHYGEVYKREIVYLYNCTIGNEDVMFLYQFKRIFDNLQCYQEEHYGTLGMGRIQKI